MARGPRVLLVVVLVSIAGCGAPIAGDGTAPGPPAVSVENGSLAVDPGRIYADLQALRGTDQPPPAAVVVRDTNGSGFGQPPPLWLYLNVSTGPVADLNRSDFPVEGSVTPGGAIVVYPHEAANTTLHRLVTAHELTHYLQVQSGLQSTLAGELDATTTDGSYVVRSLLEGDAVYTTDVYLSNHTRVRNAAFYDRLGSQLPPGHASRYGNSRYVAGHAYVRAFADSPAGVEDLYRSPPRTSEELLHALPPGSEPPVELSVTRSVGDGWRYVGSDRMGEAFLRYALESEIAPDRAAAAAAGWGNDTLEIYRPSDGGDPGYAWVLRWNDRANATNFERALGDALDHLGTPREDTWRLPARNVSAAVSRPAGRTVVVLLGRQSFLASTEVGGANATVRLRTG